MIAFTCPVLENSSGTVALPNCTLAPPRFVGSGRLPAEACDCARFVPNNNTKLPGASGACDAKLAPLTTPPLEITGVCPPVCWPTLICTCPLRFCAGMEALAVIRTCAAGCCGVQVPAQ